MTFTAKIQLVYLQFSRVQLMKELITNAFTVTPDPKSYAERDTLDDKQDTILSL